MARRKAKAAPAGDLLSPPTQQLDGPPTGPPPGPVHELDALGWGLRIHRRREPKDWPRALEDVPPEHRAKAEEYLRGIAARMRTLRAMGAQ